MNQQTPVYKKILLGLSCLAGCCALSIALLAALMGMTRVGQAPTPDTSMPATPPKSSYFGIAGFGPVNFPDYNSQQQRDYWRDIAANAQIYGVHASIQDTRLLETAGANLAMPLVWVIGHQDLADLDKLYRILDANPRVKFLGIGNEINLLRETDPKAYSDFLAAARQKFPQIKSRYQDLQLFTVFQYETLIGKGYLTGKVHADATGLLADWEEIVDLFGLTVYPNFDYSAPNQLPHDYFSALMAASDLPFAITEVSWPSAINVFQGSDQKYNTDELEQAQFISWLKSEVEASQPRFVNWTFLNDIATDNPVFAGMGLRQKSGAAKPALANWQELIAKE